MIWDKTHGSMTDIERQAPLYAIGEAMMNAVPDNGAKQVEIINYVKSIGLLIYFSIVIGNSFCI